MCITLPHEIHFLITYFIHHFNHFLYFIRADVGAVSEPKIDEDPLAEEVLALGGLVVVIDERERTSERRSADRFRPFFFQYCNIRQLKISLV